MKDNIFDDKKEPNVFIEEIKSFHSGYTCGVKDAINECLEIVNSSIKGFDENEENAKKIIAVLQALIIPIFHSKNVLLELANKENEELLNVAEEIAKMVGSIENFNDLPDFVEVEDGIVYIEAEKDEEEVFKN